MVSLCGREGLGFNSGLESRVQGFGFRGSKVHLCVTFPDMCVPLLEGRHNEDSRILLCRAGAPFFLDVHSLTFIFISMYTYIYMHRIRLCSSRITRIH